MDQKQETTSNGTSSDFRTIGNFLKKQREQQEIPLKIISRTTKISTTLLELLEGDELNQLPNKAYVKGFVKSYCKALSIDQKECLKLLEKTYLIQFPQKQPSNLVKEYSATPSSKKPKTMTTFLSHLSFYSYNLLCKIVPVYFPEQCPTPSYHLHPYFLA